MPHYLLCRGEQWSRRAMIHEAPRCGFKVACALGFPKKLKGVYSGYLDEYAFAGAYCVFIEFVEVLEDKIEMILYNSASV